MKIETIVIETEAGPAVINKSDFDKKVHTEFKEKPKAKKAEKKAK